MVISSLSYSKDLDSGFICDICEEEYSTPRWFCEICFTTRYGERDQNGEEYHGEDICLGCVPERTILEWTDNVEIFYWKKEFTIVSLFEQIYGLDKLKAIIIEYIDIW